MYTNTDVRCPEISKNKWIPWPWHCLSLLTVICWPRRYPGCRWGLPWSATSGALTLAPFGTHSLGPPRLVAWSIAMCTLMGFIFGLLAWPNRFHIHLFSLFRRANTEVFRHSLFSLSLSRYFLIRSGLVSVSLVEVDFTKTQMREIDLSDSFSKASGVFFCCNYMQLCEDYDRRESSSLLSSTSKAFVEATFISVYSQSVERSSLWVWISCFSLSLCRAAGSGGVFCSLFCV